MRNKISSIENLHLTHVINENLKDKKKDYIKKYI